ncbi:multidrug effflux MFS transporter [Sphingomonas sp. SRS2]|uniref:multidrug effflux MFS transporter n=1 Tax=Sphingomonas sp. SRS2 TaxID=133190 RepID=UPI00061846B9|nr:multidrug effflux MFS transporter [Sphingomonas sp. SRS2]KKC24005.1 major facilitator transporter [Sphingomonas sp. SRS2]
MNTPETHTPDRTPSGPGFREFVAMMAALMAVNALSIDIMLPALSVIGRDLGVTVENHQQLIIAIYLGSFGVGQLFYGPLADRYGRRSVLLTSMLVYALMSFIAARAGSFEMLLVARAFQGMAAAATRILSISIIRDRFSGRRMARVMSLAFLVFLSVPVIAPTLGQLMLLVAPWHWIFYFLGGFSLLVMLWAGLRLPETLDPARRLPISIRATSAAAVKVVTNRYSIGYSIASACAFGGMFGFLNSFPQIIEHVFHAPELFAPCFAIMGGMMAVAALVNSRIVERLGSRLVSHSALTALIFVCVLKLVIVLSGWESLISFTLTSGITFFLIGLIGSNFGSMAMEPMGDLAGTASSVQGFLGMMVSTVIGLAIGQSFAGSTIPLTAGWLLSSLAALALALWVERGRLFHAHNPRPTTPAH